MGDGGGWEAENGLNHPLTQGKSCCVFNKAQKQPQCTCQDKTVAGSSLTPHTALLVHPSGTIHPVVDRHDLYDQINAACENAACENAACESRRSSSPCHWSVWIVLECSFHVKL